MWKAPQASAARPSSTSSRRQSTARASSAPYCSARAGTPDDVGLVVLADVGGVGARHRALGAHPGDRDRGVEAAGEGDADALADGEGGQDLAHAVASPGSVVGLGSWRQLRGGARPARSPPVGSRADDQDGVIAGDGAEHLGQPGAVERAGRKCAAPGGVRSTTRLRAGLGRDQQLAEQPGQPLRRGVVAAARRQRRAVLGHDVDRQPAVGGAQLDRAELVEVARQRGLGDVDARHSSRAGASSACERTGVPASIATMRACRAALLSARAPVGRRARLVAISSAPAARQQRLLRVQPVLGLVPHDALRPVDDVGADLLAAVGRQAVQHDRVGRRRGPARRVDGVRPKRRLASAFSASCPIETQVSVATTSAPSSGRVRRRW